MSGSCRGADGGFYDVLRAGVPRFSRALRTAPQAAQAARVAIEAEQIEIVNWVVAGVRIGLARLFDERVDADELPCAGVVVAAD